MSLHLPMLLLTLLAGGPIVLRGAPAESDLFELPKGFRLRQVAEAALTGGSYDLCFDGQGRLLVGDGQRVWRLRDENRDGVFDARELIAEGLGPRGPQGLAVVGDVLYAVGGDGLQRFESYTRGPYPLTERRRLGESFRTGGDHDAHTIFRGPDNWLYFIVGDGAGADDRRHITEPSSPALRERNASVFRLSPDGKRWECIGSGGRNPPNLGLHPEGDLFTLDSDMEWHVALPWWRPVRLHHWLTGGDQGWQAVGAWPPGWFDALPGLLDVGRGSPNWGQFYEHHAFPERYRGAYFVCDYRWKSATTGGYDSAGRLLVFFFERDGASWKVKHEVFARPRQGAVDSDGRGLDFGLVDVEVSPDGALYLTDHQRGIWRLDHVPSPEEAPEDEALETAIDRLLALPQPSAEWSRLAFEALEAELGGDALPALLEVAQSPTRGLEERLRAWRWILARYEDLESDWLLARLADPEPRLRAQAAWVLGLRLDPAEASTLVRSLSGEVDPLVLRRGLEALTRNRPPVEELGPVMKLLDHPDRWIATSAALVLAHHPTSQWLAGALAGASPRRRLRALFAADHRSDGPSEAVLGAEFQQLLEEVGPEAALVDRRDLLRGLGRFRSRLGGEALRGAIVAWLRALVKGVADESEANRRELGREIYRLVGEYRFQELYASLLESLEREAKPVEQFHLAQALARLDPPEDVALADRSAKWFLGTQRGWFAEPAGKGRQFGQFFRTVLRNYVETHGAALLRCARGIELASALGNIYLREVAASQEATPRLLTLLEGREGSERDAVLDALGRAKSEASSAALRQLFDAAEETRQPRLLLALAQQDPYPPNRPYLEEGLLAEDSRVFRAVCLALARFRPDLAQDMAQLVLGRMVAKREDYRAGERFLVAQGEEQPDGYEERDPQRPATDEEQAQGVAHWKSWYETTFGLAFSPSGEEKIEERPDAELLAFLESVDAKGGSARAGREIHGRLCARCHGDPAKRAAAQPIFGPDLVGITRRLDAKEFAESLVYPSRRVEDRFRGETFTLKNAQVVSGFVTEEGDGKVTVATQEGLRRLASKDILARAPEEKSLMPGALLNRLSDRELRDLLAYLEVLGSRPTKEKTTPEPDPPPGPEGRVPSDP